MNCAFDLVSDSTVQFFDLALHASNLAFNIAPRLLDRVPRTRHFFHSAVVHEASINLVKGLLGGLEQKNLVEAIDHIAKLSLFS